MEQPELGWLPPSQFIPLAEETGLIEPIGAWVLETAAAQARAWRDAGLRELRMCVNVSARQLNQRFVETVSRVLAETGLPASALELEITEGVRLGRDPVTQATLKSLRELGVGFAIDDFGTGYATFEYIKRLPVSTLKLDGLFVGGLCENADDAAIVAASVALARGLGLRLVAEASRPRASTNGCAPSAATSARVITCTGRCRPPHSRRSSLQDRRAPRPTGCGSWSRTEATDFNPL